jgi:glyoxylase-like metal-dependent hydrolase (beta-lactamase superfamily II)
VAFNPIRIAANNPGPMTGGGNNTYLVVSGGDALLVDAGVGDPRHLSEIAAHLDSKRARLRVVLVTHIHADHASGAPAIDAAFPDVRFLKFVWPEEDRGYQVSWAPLRDGENIRIGVETMTALHTPGHSPDHLAFVHGSSRTVFTGDLVTAGSSVMIEASKGGDLRQYLSALERILALEPARLLPAHGQEISAPAAVLRQYLDHRRMRERQVIDALRSGHETVQAIAESIYHGLDPALMPAARENVRAHLAKLREEGRAVEADTLWRIDT